MHNVVAAFPFCDLSINLGIDLSIDLRIGLSDRTAPIDTGPSKYYYT